MRSDADRMFLRERNRGAHRREISGVRATRNVRRSDQRHQVRIATGSFAQVTVKINMAHVWETLKNSLTFTGDRRDRREFEIFRPPRPL